MSEGGRTGFEILEVQFLIMTKSYVSPWWSETKLIRNDFLKNLYVSMLIGPHLDTDITVKDDKNQGTKG